MAWTIDIAGQDNSPVTPSIPGQASLASVPRSGGQGTSEQGLSDTVGAVVGSGTQDGITAAYNGGTKDVDFTNTDKGSVAVAAHVIAVDPHGDRAYTDAGISAHVAATDPHGDRAYADSTFMPTPTDSLIVPTPITPASSTATGVAGTIHWDTDYVYVCIATDTWKRANLTTW